ncbi:hypothetical protein E2I00_013126, partial [Balaenoptera physalus]
KKHNPTKTLGLIKQLCLNFVNTSVHDHKKQQLCLSMGKTENFGKTHLSLGPRVEGDRCMEAIPAVYPIDIPKRVAVKEWGAAVKVAAAGKSTILESGTVSMTATKSADPGQTHSGAMAGADSESAGGNIPSIALVCAVTVSPSSHTLLWDTGRTADGYFQHVGEAVSLFPKDSINVTAKGETTVKHVAEIAKGSIEGPLVSNLQNSWPNAEDCKEGRKELKDSIHNKRNSLHRRRAESHCRTLEDKSIQKTSSNWSLASHGTTGDDKKKKGSVAQGQQTQLFS